MNLFNKSKEHQRKKTLVFDLDETLVRIVIKSQIEDISDETTHVIPAPRIAGTCYSSPSYLYVTIRPGCQDMLEQLSEKFELVLFTASHPEYMKSVLRLLK